MKMRALDIFNSLADDQSLQYAEPSDLKNLCNAITLDLQMLKEKKRDLNEYQA